MTGLRPHRTGASVYERHRGGPYLRTVDLRPVLQRYEVLPLLMAEEIRIEVRQEADEWAFDLSLRQCIEILPKHCRRPAFNIDRRNVGLLACPDLTSVRECDPDPQSKVCLCCWPKRAQVRTQERAFGLFPRDILPVRDPGVGPNKRRLGVAIRAIADNSAGGRQMKQVDDRVR